MRIDSVAYLVLVYPPSPTQWHFTNRLIALEQHSKAFEILYPNTRLHYTLEGECTKTSINVSGVCPSGVLIDIGSIEGSSPVQKER